MVLSICIAILRTTKVQVPLMIWISPSVRKKRGSQLYPMVKSLIHLFQQDLLYLNCFYIAVTAGVHAAEMKIKSSINLPGITGIVPSETPTHICCK